MGKVFSSMVKRPVRNWNVENRAQKVLDKQKGRPTVAPKHASTVDKLDQFSKEHPELLEAQKLKDERLHTMLHGLVVNPEKLGEIQSRPLPQNRATISDPEYGYLEPSRIPPGRCSIRQALEFISTHQGNPREFPAAAIAKQYKLEQGQAERVLRYFHALQIQVPGMGSYEMEPGIPPGRQAVPLAPSIGRVLQKGEAEESTRSRTVPSGGEKPS